MQHEESLDCKPQVICNASLDSREALYDLDPPPAQPTVDMACRAMWNKGMKGLLASLFHTGQHKHANGEKCYRAYGLPALVQRPSIDWTLHDETSPCTMVASS